MGTINKTLSFVEKQELNFRLRDKAIISSIENQKKKEVAGYTKGKFCPTTQDEVIQEVQRIILEGMNEY